MRFLFALIFLCPIGRADVSNPKTEAESVRRKYYDAVERYNAEVMRTGSTLGEEARELEADMKALKKRGEELRGEREANAPAAPAAAEDASPAAAASVASGRRARGGILWESLLGAGVLAGLILVGYGLGMGGSPVSFDVSKRGTAVIRCPGCAKKLRVPKRSKRVKVRCPACGKQTAYNPAKGKEKS